MPLIIVVWLSVPTSVSGSNSIFLYTRARVFEIDLMTIPKPGVHNAEVSTAACPLINRTLTIALNSSFMSDRARLWCRSVNHD